MIRSIILLIVVLLGWGVWGFFGKLSSDKLGNQILFWNGLTSFVVFLIYLTYTKQLYPFKGDMNSISFAILSGIALAIGSFAYYALLRQGYAGKVVTMAALYPIVTLILSMIFLGEKMTAVKGIGLLLSFIALYLLNL